MIVVDSSALPAVIFKEPEKQRFQEVIAATNRCVMSAVNAHETATVLRLRHSKAAVDLLWKVLGENDIEIFAFDETQVRIAAEAFDRYEKGIPRRRG
jgi:ribonuclease VapC